jgi:hypothetical protein
VRPRRITPTNAPASLTKSFATSDLLDAMCLRCAMWTRRRRATDKRCLSSSIWRIGCAGIAEGKSKLVEPSTDEQESGVELIRYPLNDQRGFVPRRPAQLLAKARILLKADISQAGDGWSDSRIAEAPDTSIPTVERTRRNLVFMILPVGTSKDSMEQGIAVSCRQGLSKTHVAPHPDGVSSLCGQR